MIRKVLVLNGPNLDMLGLREPDVYGDETLEMVEKKVSEYAERFGIEVTCFQSNDEGDLIDKIHSAYALYDGIVYNPGAHTHYSYALRDAVASINTPVVEVHISDIEARESFRRESVIAPVCIAQVKGLGTDGYCRALDVLRERATLVRLGDDYTRLQGGGVVSAPMTQPAVISSHGVVTAGGQVASQATPAPTANSGANAAAMPVPAAVGAAGAAPVAGVMAPAAGVMAPAMGAMQQVQVGAMPQQQAGVMPQQQAGVMPQQQAGAMPQQQAGVMPQQQAGAMPQQQQANAVPVAGVMPAARMVPTTQQAQQAVGAAYAPVPAAQRVSQAMGAAPIAGRVVQQAQQAQQTQQAQQAQQALGVASTATPAAQQTQQAARPAAATQASAPGSAAILSAGSAAAQAAQQQANAAAAQAAQQQANAAAAQAAQQQANAAAAQAAQQQAKAAAVPYDYAAPYAKAIASADAGMLSYERQRAVSQAMTRRGLASLLVRDAANVRWLTAFDGVFDEERAHALLVAGGRAFLHTDSRYSNAARQAASKSGSDIVVSDAKVTHPQFAYDVLTQGGKASLNGKLGIEDTITYAEFVKMVERFTTANLAPTTDLVAGLRAVKNANEILRLQAAQAVTDAAFAHIVRYIRPGMTERQVQIELEDFMLRHGAEGLAFRSIVATGANGADPHAVPGNTKLEAGQCVVLDFGAKAFGYCADMTRTVFLGRPDEKMAQAWEVLRRANEAVEAMLAPGVTGAAAHLRAEQVLQEGGFGGKMGHGLGHGVGLEVHELPVLNPKNETPLVAGNVVTVEPGIYLPGEFGMRLEDFGLVTSNGFQLFTRSTHEMLVI